MLQTRISKSFLQAIGLLGFLRLDSLPAASQRCSTFRTCAEAMESLRRGNTQIDGDRDGIPCERLCGGGGSGGQYSTAGGAGRSTATPSMRTLMAPPASLSPRPGSMPQAATRTLQPPQPVALVSVADGDNIQ